MPPRRVSNASSPKSNIPIALESEHAVLGAALRDGDCAEAVASELAREDFYSVQTASVFTAITELLNAQLTVNAVSVADRSGLPLAELDGFLESSKGLGTDSLRTVIAEVRRIGQLRAVYNACINASSSIGKDSKIETVVDTLEKGIYGVGREGQNEAKDGSDVLSSVVEDFFARHATGGGPNVSTGLRDLDRAIIGFRPGKMGVIAARPGVGKTALASTVRRAVLDQGYGAIDFALEMSAEELLERELAFKAQLNLRKILSAKDLTNEELERVRGAHGAMVSGRWYIDDRTYSIAGIRRKARVVAGRMARAGIQVGLITIDYLQLAGDHGEGREQSVAAVSRGCKFLAKELGCTVLALSQLNRACDYREDHRPVLSDIRESGSIEQDADWIAFAYREHMYDRNWPAEDAELIIAKQRSGPTGTVRLRYNPKTCHFSDAERPQTPEDLPSTSGNSSTGSEVNGGTSQTAEATPQH